MLGASHFLLLGLLSLLVPCRAETTVPPALEKWVQELQAEEEPTRLRAAESLAKANGDLLAPHAATLMALLEKEPSRLVRERLAWLVGNAGTASGPHLPRLLALYRANPDLELRRTLLRSFSQIQPTSPELVELLVEELPTPILGSLAISVLGTIGPAARSAVPALTAQLRTDDSSTRISAAIALGNILLHSPISPGGADPLPTTVDALARALGDPHLTVRQQAAQALGRIGPAAASAVPALQAVLEIEGGETADESIHAYAAWAIGEMGKLGLPAVPALRRCFENDPDPYTRKAAEAALRKLGVAPLGNQLKT